MQAEADGPLVNVIKSLPTDLRMFFQEEKDLVVAQTKVSGLEWTKITDSEFNRTAYVELDDAELESKMTTAAQTTPDKITFTEDNFKEIALEDKITDKTFVVLDNGDIYLPKVTVLEKMSTDSVIKVENIFALIFFGILLNLFLLAFAYKIIRKMFVPAPPKYMSGFSHSPYPRHFR